MKLIPALLLGVTFAATAHAADGSSTDAEWSLIENSNNRVIYSTAEDAPALILTCSDKGSIKSLISLDGDALGKLSMSSTRSRRVNGELAVGADDSAKINWAYFPSRRMASPIQNRYARRIYNAAIKGAPLTVDLGRRGEYTVSVPQLNDDFKAFAATCSAT